jgi:hypothetical protein
MWVGPYTDKLHLRLSLTRYEFRLFRKGPPRNHLGNIVQYMYICTIGTGKNVLHSNIVGAVVPNIPVVMLPCLAFSSNGYRKRASQINTASKQKVDLGLLYPKRLAGPGIFPKIRYARTDIRKHSFSVSVVKSWNRLLPFRRDTTRL